MIDSDALKAKRLLVHNDGCVTPCYFNNIEHHHCGPVHFAKNLSLDSLEQVVPDA
jgi:hypothetical protein